MVTHKTNTIIVVIYSALVTIGLTSEIVPSTTKAIMVLAYLGITIPYTTKTIRGIKQWMNKRTNV